MPSEDIEDILENSDFSNHYDDFNDYEIKIKHRRPKDFHIHNHDQQQDGRHGNDHLNFLPGQHSIYVRHWGCTHNTSDSEYMMGLLAKSGYRIVDSAAEADLWILNSCTVKTPAEDHFRNEINRAMRMGKKLVVAGCVAQSDHRRPYLQSLSIIGVQQIDKVVQVVEETLKGNVVHFLAVRKLNHRKTGGASLHMPKIRRNPYIEIIAINTGCLNQCTYCKTKHARGDLGSYHPDDIVMRAKTAFEEGVKELWITSEDTGAYGKDIFYSLPQLLFRLIEVIPEDCMMRIGMTNPPYILQYLNEMAQILQHPRVYSFLHIPVQSGSDYVLADMKRQYVIEEFCRIVDFLTEKVPGITIATDLICGFPTETEQDFQETLNLVEKYKFPTLFINQFYPRPGTPAAKMKRLHNNEVKRRSRLASALFNSYQPYKDRIYQRYHVLITEETKDKNFYVGHNKFYEQILVTKDQDVWPLERMGKWVYVEIIDFGKHHMVGRITDDDYDDDDYDYRKSFTVPEKRKYFPTIFATCAIMLIGSYVLFKVYHRLSP